MLDVQRSHHPQIFVQRSGIHAILKLFEADEQAGVEGVIA